MLKFFAEKMRVAFATHIFSAKNIRILCIKSAKTFDEMTLNELVKLTTLWTNGPWYFPWKHNVVLPLWLIWMHVRLMIKNNNDLLHYRHRLYQELCFMTYLYNFNPHKPHFYIVKLGFTGVYIIFLISAQKHRLWVLVRTASARQF